MRAAGAAVAMLAVAAAACGGSGGDKAGGREGPVTRPVGKPAVLTLVTVDDLWATEFAAAASRLSGGAIRIEIRVGGFALIDYERRLVKDVLAGKAELASVGARVWDTMGVTSLRAVVAPFLVDSLELERRIAESPSATRMLAGVEPLGLVGLAVLPGTLRRPLGLSRSLVGPRDYQGATVGIRFGNVAGASLDALGATANGYRIGSLSGLDGAELDVATIAGVGYDRQARELTGNVILWARPETIVISRAAFNRLPHAQQEILRRAGREAVAPVLARIDREQKQGLAGICARGALSLASASDSELVALRTAVQPVYDELERDALTKKLIAEIRRLRGADSTAAEVLHCPASTASVSEVEGAWERTASREELLAAGATTAEAARYAGFGRLELSDGRWVFRGAHTTVTGTHVIEGDIIRLTTHTCTANPCSPGATTEYSWSVYRDKLTLSRHPGHSYWAPLVVKPATRAG